MENSCIVHNKKTLSKFHGNINQLRRTNEFNISILKQLPKRCCSCNEKIGESIFTIDHLRKLCHEIQSLQTTLSIISEPVKPIHHVSLKSSTGLLTRQSNYKAGRFVGRGGENVKKIENELNININIPNKKSMKTYRELEKKLRLNGENIHPPDLLVFFTMKNNDNDQNNIEKIKQSLQDKWNKIDVTKKPRPFTNQTLSSFIIQPSTSIEGDSRWRPKKRIPKTKQKLREKQSNEQEEIICAQPYFKPLSMPQEITPKSTRKNKK
ncbi:unnamed protein product [Adineta steineri]|uniref:K Homology domain-containing protein n=1 Tax=Adineta steineri TaxID=433720 RepID=A0A815DBG9_9BILA|nr:unnamed protein product [Adineta steineri]CAF1572471.1 unnamed protein product [Adineta steineri]